MHNPIIIPSGKIFDAQNDKILKNRIDTVGVEQTVVAPNNEFDVRVHTETVEQFNKIFPLNTFEDTKYAYGGFGEDAEFGNSRTIYLTRFSATPQYIDVSIDIDKILDNKQITSLLLGKSSDGKANIKYSLKCETERRNISARLKFNYLRNYDDGRDFDSVDLYDIVVSDSVLETLPVQEYLFQQTYSYAPETKTIVLGVKDNIQYTVTVEPEPIELTIEYQDTLGNPQVSGLDNSSSQFHLNVRVPCGMVFYKLNPIYSMYGVSITQNETPIDVDLPNAGICEQLIPKTLEINIYGNSLSISLERKNIKFGNPNVTPTVTISNNELLQSTNYIEEENANEHLANKVLASFANGKETAEIKCVIDKYYDTAQKMAINPNLKNLFNAPQGAKNNYWSYNEDTSVISGTKANGADTRALNYNACDYRLALKEGVYSISAFNQNVHATKSAIYIISKQNSVLYEKAYNENWSGIFKITEDAEVGIMVKLAQGDSVRLMLNSGRPSKEYVDYGLPMIFPMYSVVQPYISSPSGNVPLSRKPNGDPKDFLVLKNELSFSGATYQKLFVQEL